MTAKKKRGLLSWLGFADEENKSSVDNQAEAQRSLEFDESSERVTDSETVEPEAIVESKELATEVDVADDSERLEMSVEVAGNEDLADQVLDGDLEQPIELQQVQALENDRIQEQTKPTESFFARLKRSLQRTKQNIGAGFFWVIQRQKN